MPAPVRRSRSVRFTASSARLDRVEALSTAAAAVVSTVLYLRQGHPYLARGVIGDIAGFVLLAGVLVSSRRRVRHEALVCLALIVLMLALRPEWPLRYRSSLWWAAVAAGLGGYLVVRTKVLAGTASEGRG